ncbi:MAG TPA: amidohydrolase family protein [Longimicrobiales bacterium]
MRVIDFHTHPYRPNDLNATTRNFIQDVSAAVQTYGDRLADLDFCAQLLQADGVAHAVVLPEHCPETSGHVRTETVLELCAQRPDFFIPFASVHPLLDDTPADLLQSYIAAGARGLKLYPSYQFYYPNDRRVYPLYEICQQARIPVLMHIGSSVIQGTRIKYCDPIHLDDVAVDFPGLAIVMAHGGRGFWYDVCAFLAGHFANVYIDVAGLVPSRLLEHFPTLERLADKVVFGSDWPAMPKSVGHNINAIRRLGLSDGALEKIFFANAARLLRLP